MQTVDDFEITREIGQGGYSRVFQAEGPDYNTYAMKMMTTKNFSSIQKVLENAQKEYQAMEIFADHPNILNAYYFQDQGVWSMGGEQRKCIYLALENCPNGTLSSLLLKNQGFNEATARFYFTQLLSAVGYMHSLGYAHLDIKPQNILLDENFNIRLSDFGTVEKDRGDGLTCWRKGTENYMAPEIKDKEACKGPYDMYKADIYSLGVTLYVMLMMQFPFAKLEDESLNSFSTEESEDDQDLSPKSTKFENLDQVPEELQGVMELISLMLHPDPSRRPSWEEIFSHPWMCDSSLDIRNDEVYALVSTREDPLMTPTSNYF